MDINQLNPGDIIYIAPTVGTTTTAWSRATKADNIGKLNKGESYKVVNVNVELNMVKLEIHLTPWPPSLHPLDYGGVYVDARFVSLTDPNIDPAPDPEPIPVTGDGSLKSLAAKLGRALLDWSEE